MELRIRIDAPAGGLRRLALFVGLPVALVVAAAAVAQAYDTTWIVSGKPLTAKALKDDLDEIQQRLAGTWACPVGYSQVNVAQPGVVGCVRLDANNVAFDEVVRVGSGKAAFWIDRYEASVWSKSDNTGVQYGAAAQDYPATFPVNGQVTAQGNLVYALSNKGVIPSAYITWFQANLACLASGKRLPTGPEWLLAATGTVDPVTASPGTNGACLTGGVGARATGATNADVNCASIWGAEDMIGNVWELTGDCYGAGGGPIPFINEGITPWPDAGAGYGNDGTWNVGSSAYFDGHGTAKGGVPSAALRGGNWGDGTLAGVFELSLDTAPSNWAGAVGFRCVVPQ